MFVLLSQLVRQFSGFKSGSQMVRALTFTALTPLAVPAHVPSVDGSLTAAQAGLDVRVLKRALTTLHPALTKYRSQAEIDAAFAAFEVRGNAARTSAEMYLAASELAAAIRCGHTWTNVLNQDRPARVALLEGRDKLPFTMTLEENRWLVLASVDGAVNAGDEVLSINNRSSAEMVGLLMHYLRADGSSDGKRLRQLVHDRMDYSQMDILWPLLSPPTGGKYLLRIKNTRGEIREASVAATTLALRAEALNSQRVRPIDETWRMNIVGDTAYLTLPTFSFRAAKFDWAGYLDAQFTELNRRSVRYLVIDIRDNEGGDGAIGGRLLSYLIAEPLKYRSSQAVSNYERVPYILAKYLDTWDYGFFDRTGQVERIADGTAAGKFLVVARAKFDRELLPNPIHYRGKVYLLVGPENSSAAFQFADLARKSGKVTLVGQRTGGNQRGLNGGELTWVTLPNSGVSVDIPLLAGTYTDATPDTSVEPHIPVVRSFASRARGEDAEMSAVNAEIAKMRRSPPE